MIHLRCHQGACSSRRQDLSSLHLFHQDTEPFLDQVLAIRDIRIRAEEQGFHRAAFELRFLNPGKEALTEGHLS